MERFRIINKECSVSFSAIYFVAGEILKVMVPSLLAFLAWWQSKGNQRGIVDVKERINEESSKLKDTASDVVQLHDGVRELKITVDGRLSQLLKLTESSAFARGMLESKEEALAKLPTQEKNGGT